MSQENNSQTKDLFKAILALKNIDEARRFFRDLLTEPELAEFSNRWQAAQLLNKKALYTKIEKQTGLSSRTIARVARWLNKGRGGYKLIIARLNSHHGHSSSFEKGLP